MRLPAIGSKWLLENISAVAPKSRPALASYADIGCSVKYIRCMAKSLPNRRHGAVPASPDRDEVTSATAHGQPRRSGVGFDQCLDFSQTRPHTLRPLAAQIDHQAVHAQFGVFVHGLDWHRERR